MTPFFLWSAVRARLSIITSPDPHTHTHTLNVWAPGLLRCKCFVSGRLKRHFDSPAHRCFTLTWCNIKKQNSQLCGSFKGNSTFENVGLLKQRRALSNAALGFSHLMRDSTWSEEACSACCLLPTLPTASLNLSSSSDTTMIDVSQFKKDIFPRNNFMVLCL